MTMTAFQREGLQLLGYTKRESEFLFLVATHSGYFTSRQYRFFSQTESGSVLQDFVRKLLDRKHASYHAYRSGGRVYHLFSRKVYQAIERENLLSWKHELAYIKTRLIALDFVLEYSQNHYLETEAEKLAFFEKQCSVGRETLPVRLYKVRRSADSTPRYFVDRFPMFVDRLSTPPVVTFTYVDPEAVTLDSFATHMRAYLGLFQALPRLEFIYVAPTSRLFEAAKTEFHHHLNRIREHRGSTNVLDYFRVRTAWERKERVASADVVLLKEAQTRYAGHKFEKLYEEWCRGAIAETELTQRAEQAAPSVKGAFRAIVCSSSLSLFIDRQRNKLEDSLESDIDANLAQSSGDRSIGISGTRK